ncbi:unnamed protein product [Polarella glacialis]|uniref:Uncharacterized protein n=1 Tax=Polarella glacialis TaxID=89957 RepID=A0A813LQW1_POLGL|nr:unnamed protein product [Polarella glacialis]
MTLLRDSLGVPLNLGIRECADDDNHYDVDAVDDNDNYYNNHDVDDAATTTTMMTTVTTTTEENSDNNNIIINNRAISMSYKCFHGFGCLGLKMLLLSSSRRRLKREMLHREMCRIALARYCYFAVLLSTKNYWFTAVA